jgi:hypothetical protein
LPSSLNSPCPHPPSATLAQSPPCAFIAIHPLSLRRPTFGTCDARSTLAWLLEGFQREYGGDRALHLFENFGGFRRTDLTNDEFCAQYLSTKPVRRNHTVEEMYIHDRVEELSEAIDWRDEGLLLLSRTRDCGE